MKQSSVLVMVDDLEGVFAPVLDVDKGVVQRGAVVTGEDIRGDDLVEQVGELAIGEANAVERLELFAEVLFQGGAVGDVATVFVFKVLEGAN